MDYPSRVSALQGGELVRDQAYHLAITARLAHESVAPGRFSQCRIATTRMGRDRHYWQIAGRGVVPDLSGELQAIGFTQADIHQEQVRPDVPEGDKSLIRRGGGDNLVAFGAQEGPKQLEEGPVIVDHEHHLPLVADPLGSPPGGR